MRRTCVSLDLSIRYSWVSSITFLFFFFFFFQAEDGIRDLIVTGVQRVLFRSIEVRARAAREKFLRVVEEEQAEVRQAGGYGMAIDPQVLLLEVPSSRSYEEGRDPVLQTIRAAVRRVVGDRPTNRVDEDHMAPDGVRPGRRGGMIKIGRDNLSA